MRHLKLLDECSYEVSSYDDCTEVVATVDGKDFEFSYPSYREGAIFDDTNIILADKIEANTAEDLIKHLIQKASKEESRLFTKDEKEQLYKELFHGLIIEIDKISNNGSNEPVDEDTVIDQDEARASFESAWEELDKLKKH